MTLLTAEEAAARLRMCKRTFLALGLPASRVSARKRLYREEDIEAYARSRLEYGQMDSQRQGRAGKTMPRIKHRGAPKVFSPSDLKKIAVGEKGTE